MSPCDRILRQCRAGAALDDDACHHLAGCTQCADAVALLAVLDAGDSASDVDAAWARLGDRLAAAAPAETVALRRPPLGWRVALALAAGAGSLLLVPEPMQVLIVLGVL